MLVHPKVTPQHQVRQYPFIHLGGERHWCQTFIIKNIIVWPHSLEVSMTGTHQACCSSQRMGCHTITSYLHHLAGFYQELLPDFQNQYSVNYLGHWISNTVYWPWFRFLNFYLYTTWMALRTAQNIRPTKLTRHLTSFYS